MDWGIQDFLEEDYRSQSTYNYSLSWKEVSYFRYEKVSGKGRKDQALEKQVGQRIFRLIKG